MKLKMLRIMYRLYSRFMNLQSTLPKSNSHKSNNRLSRRSFQVLFSLYSIVFNPSFSKSKLFLQSQQIRLRQGWLYYSVVYSDVRHYKHICHSNLVKIWPCFHIKWGHSPVIYQHLIKKGCYFLALSELLLFCYSNDQIIETIFINVNSFKVLFLSYSSLKITKAE